MATLSELVILDRDGTSVGRFTFVAESAWERCFFFGGSMLGSSGKGMTLARRWLRVGLIVCSTRDSWGLSLTSKLQSESDMYKVISDVIPQHVFLIL